MSDFLSNFSGDDYKEKLPKSKREKEVKPKATKEVLEEPKKRKKRRRKEEPSSNDTSQKINTPIFDDPELLSVDDTPKKAKKSTKKVEPSEEDYVSDDLHEVEIDPEYEKKQRNKKILIGVSSLAVVIIGYTTYYQMTRVKMPDFVDKSVTDVRKWATDNRMELDLKEAYSLKVESSNIIKQVVNPGKKVKKGSTLNFTVSEGADPEEIISLPDFKTMSEKEVNEFVEKNKAENLSVITEYSDKVEKGKFTRLEFGNKEVTADNYRRRDNLNVYFSKGVEIFEKNIPVPDFIGKTKAEVDEWAKKSGVLIAYEDVDSDKVEEGKIIGQSVEKNQKVAKNDKLTIKVSIGKAIVVPYFGDYTAETSATAVEGLDVRVQQVFSDSVPYGQLISQSIESGTKLTGKDQKSVKVVYSYGQPYIKSYFGQLEGDLPKLIYDDFNSKGASITYDVYYVDSDAEKGQIVKMSVYNQYIASNSYLTFGISNGRFASQPGKTPEKGPETEAENVSSK